MQAVKRLVDPPLKEHEKTEAQRQREGRGGPTVMNIYTEQVLASIPPSQIAWPLIMFN